ncbi:MAG TPA: hypothetical protein PKJ41_06510 [Bryobacteraceae bacterium]|nr:hypothetical protein [Bryobacteraceae bacterium]HPT27143.1 hypothetical protein [Bryobacteraceae bacterium]
MAAAKVPTKVRQVSLQIAADTSFKDLVKHLEIVLTLPKEIAPRGCAPCLSGLDRFVIDSKILQGLG